MGKDKEIIDGVRKKYIEQVLADNPELFKGAEDIHWSDHIKMQGVLQKHVDSSISKTINMPNNTTVGEVKEAYELAYELGCKGVTIYRDGSRDAQVLSTKSGETSDGAGVNDATVTTNNTNESVDSIATGSIWPPELYKIDLPDVAPAKRYRVSVDGQKVYINVTEDDDGQPLEVFTKFAYESDPVWNTLCRQLSLSLRYGVPLVDIVKQLDKSVVGIGDMSAKIARVLKRYLPKDDLTEILEDMEENMVNAIEAKASVEAFDAVMELDEDALKDPIKKMGGDLCPSCNTILVHQGGCLDCPSCGWSRCS